MQCFGSAADLVRERSPERPVLCLRPHAASRAAAWFRSNFPGTVVYALKANTAPEIVDALGAAGIDHFDVGSMPEVELASRISGARLFYMNPVKPRSAIARAYSEFGVRHFALDSEAELEKILVATRNAKDLVLFVRTACPNRYSVIPLEGKFGIAADEADDLLMKARQAAAELGITFHIGSQAMRPEGFSEALALAERAIRGAGVLVDKIDVGGGFPSRYAGAEPPPLEAYMAEIKSFLRRLPVGRRCEMICEPGRALVAEAESVLVRVDARRGDHLYINDGAFGTLFDAAHSGITYPARAVRLRSGEPPDLQPFSLYGPTCDSNDHMPGPYLLPGDIEEGDYVEIGQIGAYGRVLATGFNGFGNYDEAVLLDEPIATMYPEAPASADARAVGE